MATVKINEQQKEWIIKAASGVAMIIFCYVVMIQPVFSDIAILHLGIADSKKRIELFQEVKRFKKSLDGFEKNLAVLRDRSLLLAKLSDIAGEAGLNLETLTPRTQPEGFYTKLKIESEGIGSFFSLLQFLEAVEKIDAGIKVSDISLLRKNALVPSGEQPFIQIHLMFETFLKPQGGKQ